jgi:oxygen-independent coproporphyrinogen-3 oxidase
VVPEIPEHDYTGTLLRELKHYAGSKNWHGRAVQSIFFGGGTPSTFKPASIEKILGAITMTFPTTVDCEITLEANPATVDAVHFTGFKRAGVNRISLGVQSFQSKLLKFLGRAHSADEAKRALQMVDRAGFDNFSMDLIYANPGQTLRELENDLDAALEFQPPHMSAYNLTFEEGTPFHRDFRAGRMQNLDEEEEIVMAELIEAKLESAGLYRYEISNYGKSGRQSRHNINYWHSGDYLGLGAGAHSYVRDAHGVGGERWSNEKNPGRYMSDVSNAGHGMVDCEAIGSEKAAAEFMFLGLRMIEGISLSSFRERFGQSPLDRYPEIANWVDGALLEEKADFLRFTRKGLLVANSIFVHFM